MFSHCLAAMDYIRNVNKQRPTLKLFVSTFLEKCQMSNVNKTVIVNSTDELVKQNVVVNKKSQLRL